MSPEACEDCRRARAGMWCGYTAGCTSCAARSIARSMCAFEAVRTRQTAELRETLARVLPALDYDQSRAMVWDWWRIDHPARTATA